MAEESRTESIRFVQMQRKIDGIKDEKADERVRWQIEESIV
jgi:hypothetical protein